MRRALLLGIAVAITCLISGCGDQASDGSNPSGDASLDGRTFVGDDVTRQGDSYPLVEGSTITMSFDASSVGASAGCNHMSGDASWNAGTLELTGGLAMTEMGCKSALMDQDKWLADFLQSSPQLGVNSNVLTLNSAGTAITLTEAVGS
jgi:heat shock protein HslJ